MFKRMVWLDPDLCNALLIIYSEDFTQGGSQANGAGFLRFLTGAPWQASKSSEIHSSGGCVTETEIGLRYLR